MDRPLAVGMTPLETRREVLLHVATRAEELGFSRVSLAEGWGHDAFVLLTEIALRTSRIGLATGVVNVLGRTPAQLAMAAATLDEVSGGRFRLGLGAGSPALAEGLHGRGFREPAAALGRTVREIRRLLDGERAQPLPGARGLRLAARPSHRVPIDVAALGTASTRLAGELGDAWSPFLVPRSGLKAVAAPLEEGAAAAERPRPAVNPGLPTAISDDPTHARGIASWWVGFYLTSMGPLYAAMLRRLGLGGLVDDVLAANPSPGTTIVPDSAGMLLDELVLWGEPAAARALLARWYEAGVDEPTIVLPPGRPLDELDLILESTSPLIGAGPRG